jgi:SCY1-like protein 2
MMHGNLLPHAVYINTKSDWKLGGFSWSRSFPASTDNTSFISFNDYDVQVVELLRPDLNYLAPESVLDRQIGATSDIFALGCLIYTVFHKGNTVLETHDSYQAYKVR